MGVGSGVDSGVSVGAGVGDGEGDGVGTGVISAGAGAEAGDSAVTPVRALPRLGPISRQRHTTIAAAMTGAVQRRGFFFCFSRRRGVDMDGTPLYG